MADFAFNIAKGRAVELYDRVDSNDPTNAGLTIVAIVTTAGDSTLIDLDTLALVLANGNTAEATNTNYARIDLDDSDLTAFAPDDANDRTDLDFADQTFSSISAGDNWTDILICYNPDITSDVDANIVPISQHDFAVTPDGSDITMQLGANGFYRAA